MLKYYWNAVGLYSLTIGSLLTACGGTTQFPCTRYYEESGDSTILRIDQASRDLSLSELEIMSLVLGYGYIGEKGHIDSVINSETSTEYVVERLCGEQWVAIVKLQCGLTCDKDSLFLQDWQHRILQSSLDSYISVVQTDILVQDADSLEDLAIQLARDRAWKEHQIDSLSARVRELDASIQSANTELAALTGEYGMSAVHASSNQGDDLKARLESCDYRYDRIVRRDPFRRVYETHLEKADRLDKLELIDRKQVNLPFAHSKLIDAIIAFSDGERALLTKLGIDLKVASLSRTPLGQLDAIRNAPKSASALNINHMLGLTVDFANKSMFEKHHNSLRPVMAKYGLLLNTDPLDLNHATLDPSSIGGPKVVNAFAAKLIHALSLVSNEMASISDAVRNAMQKECIRNADAITSITTALKFTDERQKKLSNDLNDRFVRLARIRERITNEHRRRELELHQRRRSQDNNRTSLPWVDGRYYNDHERKTSSPVGISGRGPGLRAVGNEQHGPSHHRDVYIRGVLP